jgi:hypothetical protein
MEDHRHLRLGGIRGDRFQHGESGFWPGTRLSLAKAFPLTPENRIAINMEKPYLWLNEDNTEPKK